MADRGLFNAYSSDVGRFADAASLRISQLLDRLGATYDDESYQLLRRYYLAVAQRYGRDAAGRAMEYYQAERDAARLDQGYEAASAGEGESSWYEQDVDEATGRTSTGEGHSNVAPSDLTAKVAQRVMERADKTITLNARRDPARPKWAFVAHPGACGFCVMVSSNGWAYSETGAKAQRHENCRCTVAVSFDNDPSLDGYDPDAMRDAYAKAEDAVHDDVEREWAAMSDEERRAYGRKGRSAKDVYKTRRITAEMDRRDRAWLQDPSKPSKLHIADRATPEEHEIMAGRLLTKQGFGVEFKPRSLEFKQRRADFTLNGTTYELKDPTGNGHMTVFNQFKSAVFGQNKHERNPQSDRLVISNVRSEITLQEMERQAVYVMASGEFPEIREVYLLDRGGSLVLVTQRSR